MKKLIALTASVLMVLCAQNVFAAANNSPVGLWKTIDDVTGKPKAIIEITETAQHTLQGTVVKIFPIEGHDQNELCAACKGPKHNQKIVGMTVLEGLRADKNDANRWGGGEILDPKNGKTYHSTVQLTDGNQKLNVRGYIGMPLFGRTQIWHRVNDVNG